VSDKENDGGKDSGMLNRRDFIRRAGASAGAVAVGGVAGAVSLKAGANEPTRNARTKGVDYDVIVLGGGFAGVTAARNCSKNGYKTLLLEARDRLGGRTYTSQFAGHQVELGGTWIHWTQPFVWSEVQRYKLEVVETPEMSVNPTGDTVVVLVDGRREHLETPEQLGPLVEAFDKYFGNANTFWERPYDASFHWKEIVKGDKLTAKDVLQKMDFSPLQKVAVESYVTGMGHCAPERGSYVEMCRWWALPGSTLTSVNDADIRYRFKHGTISLINKMVEDGTAEIRLATPVKSVDDRGDHVVVTTTSGQSVTAASVIVGLPMNVLPNVQFSPALDPLVVEAGRETHTGRGIKLLIKVKGRLTSTTRLTGMAVATHPLPLVLTYQVADDHTILVVFGPDPKRIDYADKVAVQTALRDYFPNAVVDEVHFNPWTTDPYSNGTFASYRPGWFEKYYDHFQKDRGRVFFGQGDHGEGWRGFIDGAIGAGASAAQRVKTRLG